VNKHVTSYLQHCKMRQMLPFSVTMMFVLVKISAHRHTVTSYGQRILGLHFTFFDYIEPEPIVYGVIT